LYEAGRTLDDPGLIRAAQRLAERLPLRWPNPDICHGAAGAGMGQLHFLLATGRDAYAGRVRECADGLLQAAVAGAGGPRWPVPVSFDSISAGESGLGFAHGTAGIGTFLLAAGTALDEPRYVRAAHEAGETLRRAARTADGMVWWPVTWEAPEREPDRLMRWHWCTGASGIGTFLLRLWAAGGDPVHRRLAEQAAEGGYGSRWQAGTAACHGLAGDADYLLDLADLLGDQSYRRRADEVVSTIWARHARRGGRSVVADESRTEIRADFGTGLAGVLGFLLRRQHGGPRWWLAGDPGPGAAARAKAASAAPRHRPGDLPAGTSHGPYAAVAS
jgi:lantibiotic modifying enzyme